MGERLQTTEINGGPKSSHILNKLERASKELTQLNIDKIEITDTENRLNEVEEKEKEIIAIRAESLDINWDGDAPIWS